LLQIFILYISYISICYENLTKIIEFIILKIIHVFFAVLFIALTEKLFKAIFSMSFLLYVKNS